MTLQHAKLLNRTVTAQDRAYARLNAAQSYLRARRSADLINGYERRIWALVAGQITPYR